MSQAGKRIIDRFDGKDYAIWALHMKNLLREKKLVKYVDRMLAKGQSGYIKADDEQVLADIQFTMDNMQVKLIMYCKTALEAWEKLRENSLFTVTLNKV